MSNFLINIRRILSRPEYFFLIVGGFFVIFFCFIDPPLQSLDEQAHFYRIIEISQGHPMSRHTATFGNLKRYGDTFPASYLSEISELIDGVDHHTGKYNEGLVRTFSTKNSSAPGSGIANFEGSAVYSPIPYMPQVTGYTLSSLFTHSLLLRMYAARLANGIVWLLLIYLAIRLVPFGKWSAVVFALLPENVFLASSLSADASVTSLSFLLVAYVLYLRSANRHLSAWQLTALFLLTALLGLAKSSYYFLIPFILLIPGRLFPWRKLTIPALLVLPLILAASWNYAVSPIADSLHRSFFGNITYTPSEQVHFMVTHPFSVVAVLFNSIFSNASNALVQDMFGTFTWYRVSVPLWLQMASCVILFFILCYQLGRTPRIYFSTRAKLLISAIIMATVCSIFLTLYIVWSSPGSNVIDGVQGRYFLPLALLLLPLFTSSKKIINITQRTYIRLAQYSSIVLLVATSLSITWRFY